MKSDRDIPEEMTLHIKNMVCDRCIMSVNQLFRDQGFHVKEITLGEAVVSPEPDGGQMEVISQQLQKIGFELADDRKQVMVTAIKTGIISYLKLIEEQSAGTHQNDLPVVSEFLSGQLHKSYPTLSRLFTSAEGITIEKYLIRLRIERVKELLSYGDMTLSEIAWRMGYSSVQHLSGQFKGVVGVSVSEYNKQPESQRKALDSVY